MNRHQFIRAALQGAAALSSVAFLGLRGVPDIVAQEVTQRGTGLTVEKLREAKRIMDEGVSSYWSRSEPVWFVGKTQWEECQRLGITHAEGGRLVPYEPIPEFFRVPESRNDRLIRDASYGTEKRNT